VGRSGVDRPSNNPRLHPRRAGSFATDKNEFRVWPTVHSYSYPNIHPATLASTRLHIATSTKEDARHVARARARARHTTHGTSVLSCHARSSAHTHFALGCERTILLASLPDLAREGHTQDRSHPTCHSFLHPTRRSARRSQEPLAPHPGPSAIRWRCPRWHAERPHPRGTQQKGGEPRRPTAMATGTLPVAVLDDSAPVSSPACPPALTRRWRCATSGCLCP
jgi:hypothetical protein